MRPPARFPRASGRALALALALLPALGGCPAPAPPPAGLAAPDAATGSASTVPAPAATPLAAVAPTGLPTLSVPVDNPLTSERVDLGRKLFFDPRLSFGGRFACATCHDPAQAFTTAAARAIGNDGVPLARNAPTLLNAAHATTLFHDGRETTLEHQVWGPLLAPREMGNPSIGSVIERVRDLEDYGGLFERAFGGSAATMLTLAQALAAYQRTLLSADSRFDRWYYRNEASALDATEQAGFAVFTGKGRCSICHTLYGTHALFSDMRFHNTGVAWGDGRAATTQDRGRGAITGVAADERAFRTPMLRDIARTAPYMHDGSIATLEAVIAFYDRGGSPDPGLSPLMQPLRLDASERAALLAFLRALDGAPPPR
jgi:cytochrome c peroxidase